MEIENMLDTNTSAQLKTLLERLESPIELVGSLDIAKFLIIYHNRSYGILNRF